MTATLCVVVCGAGPARDVGVLVGLAQAGGWVVRVVATPAGAGFVDLEALGRQTGVPVRSDFLAPGTGPRSPAPDAVIVAPATFNTVNKLAAGIADTYALTVVAEVIGRGAPVAVLPFVNTALAARKPFVEAVGSLRAEGVDVLVGARGCRPHPPGAGGTRVAAFPWETALHAVAGRTGRRGTP